MSLKDKLQPVTAMALLQAAGVVYAAACYTQTTKTCAVTNNLVADAWNPAGQCFDYWYATQDWTSPDAPISSLGPDRYNALLYDDEACSGLAKKFDCSSGTFGSPVPTTSNRGYVYDEVDTTSGQCSP